MFGYITINKAEMKFREFAVYQSYYCGLCRVLKERHGLLGQLTLTYDMTFLLLLLTGLYEPGGEKGQYRCVVHPFVKHTARVNAYTEYAADMNLLLSYYKCQDDWSDEKKVSAAALSRLLRKGSRRVKARYPQKAAFISQRLRALYANEKKGDKTLDEMAGLFGDIMGELFVYREDEWAPHLRRMGFYLGKFIYLLDAYEDVEEDCRAGNYNPLKELSDAPDFSGTCKGLLDMMMAECCREFELLPIIKYAEILRNILYAGVWRRFAQVTARRKQEQEGQEKKNAGSL